MSRRFWPQKSSPANLYVGDPNTPTARARAGIAAILSAHGLGVCCLEEPRSIGPATLCDGDDDGLGFQNAGQAAVM
jgi:hypothetical protein